MAGRGEKDPAVVRLQEQVKKLHADIVKVSEKERPRLVKELKDLRRQRLQMELSRRRPGSGRSRPPRSTTRRSSRGGQGRQTQTARAKVDMYQSEITHLEGLLKQLKGEREAIDRAAEPVRHRVIEAATVQRHPR